MHILAQTAQIRLSQVFADRNAELPEIGSVSASDYFEVVWGLMRIANGEGGMSCGFLPEAARSVLLERHGSGIRQIFDDAIHSLRDTRVTVPMPMRHNSVAHRANLALLAVPLADAWPKALSSADPGRFTTNHAMNIIRGLPLWAKNALLPMGWSREFLFGSKGTNR